MRKKNNKTKIKLRKKVNFLQILGITVNVSAITLIIFTFFLFGALNLSNDFSQLLSPETDSNLILESQYQKELKNIQSFYNQAIYINDSVVEDVDDLKNKYSRQEETIKVAKESLLELRVPSQYLDLHMGLLACYNLVEKSANQILESLDYHLGSNNKNVDLEKAAELKDESDRNFKQAQAKMSSLIQEYTWLAN